MINNANPQRLAQTPCVYAAFYCHSASVLSSLSPSCIPRRCSLPRSWYPTVGVPSSVCLYLAAPSHPRYPISLSSPRTCMWTLLNPRSALTRRRRRRVVSQGVKWCKGSSWDVLPPPATHETILPYPTYGYPDILPYRSQARLTYNPETNFPWSNIFID